MQEKWWERSPRQGMQETKRWRQTGVSGNGSNIGITRRGILGSSYAVEDSRHASGQWLYWSHSDEYRCVPGFCAHSISGQKSQRRGFKSGGQRLCEDQHTLKQRWEFQCELKNVLCVPEYSSNFLSVSKWTEWGHSFTFVNRKSWVKLQKGTRVKLTQENNLFYLPCSVLEFKMSSNSVKPYSARKWNRRLGQLNRADVVRNAPETVGELDDVCNVCALAKITKTPVPRVAETQAEEKPERMFTDVMGPFRVESLSGFWFCNVFADQ